MKPKSLFKKYRDKCNSVNWIITHLPENYEKFTYVEPYSGGADVLLSKNKSDLEVINDINPNLINVYRALRDEPEEFISRLEKQEHSESIFRKALINSEDYLEIAINEYILNFMSKKELKEAFTKSQKVWKTAINKSIEIKDRLKEVFIFNKKAIDIIQLFNSENTILYCDPPYLMENRTSKTVYSSKLSPQDHIDLAYLLNNYNGKVILSGYSSPLYNRLYKNWSAFSYSNNKNQDKNKLEMLWKNF